MKILNSCTNPGRDVHIPQETKVGMDSVPKELDGFDKQQELIDDWRCELTLDNFMQESIRLQGKVSQRKEER